MRCTRGTPGGTRVLGLLTSDLVYPDLGLLTSVLVPSYWTPPHR